MARRKRNAENQVSVPKISVSLTPETYKILEALKKGLQATSYSYKEMRSAKHLEVNGKKVTYINGKPVYFLPVYNVIGEEHYRIMLREDVTASNIIRFALRQLLYFPDIPEEVEKTVNFILKELEMFLQTD